MKKFLTILFVSVFGLVGTASAGTYIFGGSGADYELFQENADLRTETNIGVSVGFSKSLSPRWSFMTVYDYTKNDLKKDSTSMFKREITPALGYLLTDTTSRLGISLLAGIDVVDGNIPDFGTYISLVNGIKVTYNDFLTEGLVGAVTGSTIVGDKYSSFKVRAWLAYPIPIF